MKLTNEEKKILIDEACDLFSEAAERINKAEKLLKKCGIEICGGFDAEKVPDHELHSRNCHIYAGIQKMSEAVGVKTHIRGKDKSTLYLKYKDLVFLQIARERTEENLKFTFR